MVTQSLPQKSKQNKTHFLVFLFLIGDAFSLDTCVSTTAWHSVVWTVVWKYNSVETEFDLLLLPSLPSLALTGILLPVSESQQHFSNVCCMQLGVGAMCAILIDYLVESG